MASLFGQVNITTRVTAPTSRAGKIGSITAAGMAVRAGMVPLASGSWPNRRDTCRAMMMQPMPLMKPDTTG